MIAEENALREERVCRLCGKEPVSLSRTLPVCLTCLRSNRGLVHPFIERAHHLSRKPFGLPESVPRDSSGITCQVCVNECQISDGRWGFCGLRTQRRGTIQGVSSSRGNVDWYYDGLPTNCVADWVCPGGSGAGYPEFAHADGPEYGYKNLAVFYHGCSFDCLFCQNWTHREGLWNGKRVPSEALSQAVDDRTSCICHFGGDPTPQLPHAIDVSRRALKRARGRILRICWETNGSMNPALLKEVVELSLTSGGCIKFDIKAWSDSLHQALCGISSQRTKENFERVAQWIRQRPDPPLLIASTLLIPGYIDEEEIRNISTWIASLNPEIPYALLVFYPHFLFKDVPVTSRELAVRCKEVAGKAGLRRVRIGNLHLLGES